MSIAFFAPSRLIFFQFEKNLILEELLPGWESVMMSSFFARFASLREKILALLRSR